MLLGIINEQGNCRVARDDISVKDFFHMLAYKSLASLVT